MSLKRSKPDFQKRLHEVPHKPGVYLMKDRLDRVIYVGKARDLRKRLANYFTPSRKRMANLKTRALIDSIWDFQIHEVRNEPEALLLEGKLIKEYRPRYNVSFRDDKRFLLAKIHPDDPFPKFQLVRLKKDDGARYFGPFAHSGSLRTTINWLNREFGLRSCRPLRPTENDYRHCNDDVIKNCSAPCIGKITAEEYLGKIDEACKFLEGQSKEAIQSLEDEMHAEAQKMNFERAAQLRDMLEDMRRTLRPTRQFTRGRGLPQTREEKGDTMGDVIDLQDALGLDRPPVVMECFDISNISTTHCVASMVRFTDGRPDNANYRRYRIRTVDGQDDFASMAEVVRRRYSRILLEAQERAPEELEDTQERPLEAMRRLEESMISKGGRNAGKKAFVRLPDLVVVDGGKGQLSSALKELQRLDLGDLPIVGLAKEREEIFRPGNPIPVVLPHDRGALQLMQRIRDEAHRFANGYHQLLMKRRIAESILDDCPGVSETRKKALLKTFGSVTRLRKASCEEIAAVRGISSALAEEIHDFLRTHR